MEILKIKRVKLVSEEINQTAHGLALRLNVYRDTATGLWVEGQSDNQNTLTDGVVIEIIDADNFLIGYAGRVMDSGHGLAMGRYFLNATDGTSTLTSPVTGYKQNTIIVDDADSYLLGAAVALQL